MPEVTRCERGGTALLRVLGRRLHDLREETPDTFGRWLTRHLRGWSLDPVFQQRVRIREIRRDNPLLQTLERERHVARSNYEASADHAALEKLRRELAGGENAVAGLEHALSRAGTDDERVRLRDKLASYREMVVDLRNELDRLRAGSTEWRELHEIVGKLAEARATTNFDRETAKLTELQRDMGRSSGRSGSAFELSAVDAVRREVLPDLERDLDTDGLLILRSVRLGSARAEFDHLVVRASEDPARPVDVVAAVEAKRNPNDLAHGFRHRVDDLRWFAGAAVSHDPESYRTATFPTGHFDRSAVHVERDGRRFIFAPESFVGFAGDLTVEDGDVHLPDRLYLVSRAGSLWGIGSGGLARIAHRVSSDVEFDLADSDYLASLLEWSRRLTHPLETPDLLRRFAANENDASRILLLSQE